MVQFRPISSYHLHVAWGLSKIALPAFVKMLWTVAPWCTLFLSLDSLISGVFPPLKSWVASLVLNEIQRSLSGDEVSRRWVISLTASSIALSIIGLVLNFGRKYATEIISRKMETHIQRIIMEAELRSDMPGLLDPAISDIIAAAKVFAGRESAIDRKGSIDRSVATRSIIENVRDVRSFPFAADIRLVSNSLIQMMSASVTFTASAAVLGESFTITSSIDAIY